jgi:uncharacterized protein (DUF169 family)
MFTNFPWPVVEIDTLPVAPQARLDLPDFIVLYKTPQEFCGFTRAYLYFLLAEKYIFS